MCVTLLRKPELELAIRRGNDRRRVIGMAVCTLLLLALASSPGAPTSDNIPSVWSLLDIRRPPSVKLDFSSADENATSPTSWVRDNATFVYIGASTPASGILFHLPISEVKQMVFFKRPISRLLTSNNLIKVLNAKPDLDYSLTAAVLSHRRDEKKTPDKPGPKAHGGAKSQPTGANPPTVLENIKPNDFFTPENRFILNSELSGAFAKRACFVDPMDTLVPTDYAHVRTTIFGSNTAEVLMKVGVQFASVTISMEAASPVELILSSGTTNMTLLWPPMKQYDPMNGSSRHLLSTYLLGTYQNASDMELKAHADMVSSVDDLLDYNLHITQAHSRLFISASMPASTSNYIHGFRIVTTRLFLALVASVHAAFKSGYVSLDELIKREADLKVIAAALCNFAPSTDPGTCFLLSRTHVWNEKAAILTSVLKKKISDVSRGTHSLGIARQLYLFRSVYAFDIPREKGEWGARISDLALNFITSLHEESVRDAISWNASTRHALYYAFDSVFQRSPMEWRASHNARKSLLFASSMCTEEHIAAAELTVQDMYIRLTRSTEPVHILDAYTPCMTSLRIDISERRHRVYAMANVVYRPVIEEYLENTSQGVRIEEDLQAKAESVIAKLRTSIGRTVATYASEVLECSGTDRLESDTLLVLPISGIGSYIVTRRAGVRGIVYTVDGVDVNNQLYITYARLPCTSTSGIISPAVLPRPLGKECPYCGCVLLRYSASGHVRHAIYISSRDLQRELLAAGNSSVRYFNPTTSSLYGTSLLLYPNGTVVRILAFESQRIAILSATYIATTAAGVLIAAAIAIVTAKMLVSNFRYHGYEKLRRKDDLEGPI